MSENFFVSTFKFIAIEIIWDIIYFPIWWYSKGLARVAKYCVNSAVFHVQRRLALGVWLRNIFKPMYGDYTKEGWIISIAMRIVVLIWKLLAAIFWLVFLFLLFIIWLALPILVICYLLYQLFDVPLLFIKKG